jgi:hypothetical protein
MYIKAHTNPDGSLHFGSADIKSGESYLDALCRTIPKRERALSGLGLKLMALRLQKEETEEQEQIVLDEINRLTKMTNEEYEKYENNI